MNDVEYTNGYALKLLKSVSENLFNMQMITDEILICNNEEIGENICKRDEYFENMQKYYEQLKTFCTDENKDFSDIMSGNSDYSLLSDELKPLFDERQKIAGLAASIKSKDFYVQEKLSSYKDELLDKIKQLNTGNEATASRYYKSASPVSSGVYFPKRNKQI